MNGPPAPPDRSSAATPPEDPQVRIDGLRAWLAQVERKLGVRSYAGAAGLVLALAAAAVALVLVLQLNDDAATKDDLAELRADAPAVVRRRFPDYEAVYAERGWKMLPSIDRVYVNARARAELGWTPRYDFGYALDRLKAGEDYRSALALSIGAKGYHPVSTGVYTARSSESMPSGPDTIPGREHDD
jgi:hypothetical protein